tara:strand:- start:10134 stop:12608 length:2475 start_codon:yes stop_codon:yes gene_type:complete
MIRVGLIVSTLLYTIGAFAQSSISGTITNEDGEKLIGATVSIFNSYQGAVSNLEGFYQIDNIEEGKGIIQVYYMGYETISDTVELKSGTTTLDFKMTKKAFIADEFVVSATRSNDQTPMAETTLSKEQIEENNQGQDLPYVIRLTPSVVTTSDAGAGVGYTGVRIRGSDATRINVTINGIPLNDPESQGVWWVNMPDFASSINSMQIQRGVGTSTNGAGAFGGSINMQTNEQIPDPYGELNLSGGSYGTVRANVQFGTGTIGKGFSIDGRLSKIQSDGYIDRASSDLESYYFSAAHHGKKSSVRFITFGGHETTYQAWNGVPKRYLDTNRTFNPYDYHNEVDDYRQTHYQLLTNFELTKKWNATINFHYTKGGGYFEQYKGDEHNALLNKGSKEDLADYKLDPVITDKGDTITETNLIRQRWLDNDFYGAVFSFNYDANGKLKAVIGGAINQYIGKHFGKVIWSEYTSNGLNNHEYYRNDATKNDFNIYGKANYQAADGINIFADLQYRMVNYEYAGIDDNGADLRQVTNLDFWNPKLGMNMRLNSSNEVYLSGAMAHREPNRKDYINNSSKNQPSPEQLYDYELGYNYRSKKLGVNLNLFYMDYFNQLVVTGEYDDVGSAKRINVPNSYRAGVELIVGYKPVKRVEFNANITLSQNKIEAFTEFKDDWDTGGQNKIKHSNTDIAFSPNAISGQELKFWIFQSNGKEKRHDLSASLLGKYVGAQYIDNTQNDNRKLDAYYTNDLRFDYKIHQAIFNEVGVYASINNLFDQKYISNAWSYAFSSPGYDPTPDDPYVNSEGGDNYNMIGYFPNATRYFMVGLRIKL